jgi:hypothetical protein
MRYRVSSLPLAALLACTASCKEKPVPQPEPPPPAVSQSAAPPPITSAAAAPRPEGAMTLTLEKFEPEGTKPSSMYPIEGALLVHEGQRVGRVAGDKIEWIGKIPKETPGYGADNVIENAYGRWPDFVGVVYTTGNGRAPNPTFVPLVGKGIQKELITGAGFWGIINLGESFVAVTSIYGVGIDFTTVRGRPIARTPISFAEAGCKSDEVKNRGFVPDEPALRPEAAEATAAGTIVVAGELCDKRGPAAEIWDKNGKARIVELAPFWGKKSAWASMVRGSGDEVFITAGPWVPVLRYHDGEITALPYLDRPVQRVFTSGTGQIHASDGEALFRLEGGKWNRFAVLPPKLDARRIAFVGEDLWAQSWATVYRLRPGPPAQPEEECKTPFVYMYKSSYKNDAKFTYPSTQKALSTFPEVSQIGLVEFGESYSRHLGITVTSKAQGEAVVAHVKATMPDEDPHYFCYAPANVRRIEMGAPVKK